MGHLHPSHVITQVLCGDVIWLTWRRVLQVWDDVILNSSEFKRIKWNSSEHQQVCSGGRRRWCSGDITEWPDQPGVLGLVLKTTQIMHPDDTHHSWSDRKWFNAQTWRWVRIGRFVFSLIGWHEWKVKSSPFHLRSLSGLRVHHLTSGDTTATKQSSANPDWQSELVLMASYRVQLLGRSGVSRPDEGLGGRPGQRGFLTGFVQGAGTGRKLCSKTGTQHVLLDFRKSLRVGMKISHKFL